MDKWPEVRLCIGFFPVASGLNVCLLKNLRRKGMEDLRKEVWSIGMWNLCSLINWKVPTIKETLKNQVEKMTQPFDIIILSLVS